MTIKKYDQDHEYRTTDIYLSAFLIAGGHASLSHIEPVGPGRKTFVLAPVPRLEAVQAFYSRGKSSFVAARSVLEELRGLKAMVVGDTVVSGGRPYG